jgi:hypothetical protein
MIEPILHLLLEDPIEQAEVNDESSLRIDRSRDCYVADVAMAVKILPRARAKGAGVFFLTPFWTAVAMGR